MSETWVHARGKPCTESVGIEPVEPKSRITPTLTTRADLLVWRFSLLMTLWVPGCNGDNPVGPTAPFNPLDVPAGPSVSGVGAWCDQARLVRGE